MPWSVERKLERMHFCIMNLVIKFHASVIIFDRYAKALHYKEQEFHENKNTEVLETLIMINNKLQQKEAAQGLLEYVLANRSAVEEPKVGQKGQE